MALLSREQLEDRLAALHRASLELVSDLSLETVLKRIVQMAREQVEAAYAALGVVDEEGNLVEFITEGMTEKEILQTGSKPIGRGMIGALKNERRTIRISSIQKDSRSAGFPPGHPMMKSFLGVPIILGNQLLGQIYLTDKETHTEFTALDERVIEILAAYAAVAINNAHLYEDLLERDEALRHRNQELALVDDIATSLTTSLDLDEIMEETLSQVMEYVQVDAGEIYLVEEADKHLVLGMHQGELPDTFSTKERIHIGEGFVGRVAKSGKPLSSCNLRRDMSFLNPAVLAAGYTCIAFIPLTARSKVAGVMILASREQEYFEHDLLNLLTAIGTWSGITIENAQLHRQAQRLAVLEERERIGMDLHDGIIQSIYAVGLALEYARVALEEDPKQSLQKIETSIEGLNKIIRDIRAYILDLRPRQMASENLVEALQRLVEEYRVNTLTDAVLIAPEEDSVNLPPSHSMALFHICQEALANAAKHSQARRTIVHLWMTKDRILIEISDNGRGFDLRKTNITMGHGLSNMHIRARKIGGDVEITSAPEEGTTVLAWVPRRTQ